MPWVVVGRGGAGRGGAGRGGTSKPSTALRMSPGFTPAPRAADPGAKPAVCAEGGAEEHLSVLRGTVAGFEGRARRGGGGGTMGGRGGRAGGRAVAGPHDELVVPCEPQDPHAVACCRRHRR
jgi:hypothetical protein